MNCLAEHSPTFFDRKALFPGESCFPISPTTAKQQEENLIISPSGLPCSSKDQLAKILSILGTPNEEDISFITDNKAIEYILSFPKCKRIDLGQRYPAAPK
jgi:mitogen-activated protein kinase 1/3